MPYLAHFALASHPFGLTPNTEQYFPTANNTHILHSLSYATAKRGGILKVVGDVGTGKTMLCRLLLRTLMDVPETHGGIAYLNAPQSDGEWLLAALCIEFGLDETGNRAQVMHRLNQFLLEAHAAGRTCVVVVDEAQALGPEGLETIRLLSNLETETAKLLQIVLFGQPELDALLARPDLRQINQRIVFAFTTQPLSAAEAGAYVQHRMRCARLAGVDFPAFSPPALTMLAKASRGVPRIINILADKSLLIAYGDSAMPVTEDHVSRAIEDSRAIVGGRPALRRTKRAKLRRGPWGRRLLWGIVAAEVAVVMGLGAHALDLPSRLAAFLNAPRAEADPAAGVAPAVMAGPTAPEPAAAATLIRTAPVRLLPPPQRQEQAALPPQAEITAPAEAPALTEAPTPAAVPETAAAPAEPSPDPAPPVPPVVPSSLPTGQAPRVAAPLPAVKPKPPVAAPAVKAAAPAPAIKVAAEVPEPVAPSPAASGETRIRLTAAPGEEETLTRHLMPDGTWRWE